MLVFIVVVVVVVMVVQLSVLKPSPSAMIFITKYNR